MSKGYRAVGQGTARAFVFLLILVFVLCGVSWFLSVRAVQGEIRAKASVVQLCQAGNVFRGQQVTLWQHLVDVSVPPPHQTAAQKAQRARLTVAFLGFVHRVFASRDCGHLNG